MTYTLQPHRGETLLRFTEQAPLIDLERGSALARSLGGRFARGYVGWHLAPAASRKFRALFDAGFTAYHFGPDHVWRYGRTDEECLRLPGAVKIAREVLTAPAISKMTSTEAVKQGYLIRPALVQIELDKT